RAWRSLPVGHGLDPGLRGRQLRGGRALPHDRPPERHRARPADGRRLRQGLSLVAEDRLASFQRDRPGLSAFVRENGAIYHTHSTYARGLVEAPRRVRALRDRAAGELTCR
ncbi:MAG: DUF899 family protein, partial [Alphaproteobacteria bacterium]|nr:DUF899 family protein [Alphaproteobacteria bacterium]